jgi:hypothetical protein
MRLSLFFILLFLLGTSAIFSQTLNAYEKAADEAFDKEDYYNAVHYYEIVLKSKQKPGIYYKYAEACRHSFAYKKAETAYQKVIESNEKSRYDKVEFYYALVLKHNAKYDEAAQFFESFTRSKAAVGYYKDKALQELASCPMAKNLFENPSDSVKIERFGDNINTEYSDFSAHEIGEGDQFIYSSLRFDRKPEKNEKVEDKRMISKLLLAESEEGKGKEIGKLNTKEDHNANSCLSPDGKRIYFTRCSGQNNDSVICRIYLSRLQEDKSWSKPTLLPAPLNLVGFTHTQPSIAVENDSEWLYFASDRPGGLGGMDIWVSKLLSDTVTDIPKNLGEQINSVDNEATPFYHSKTKRLYFSSQWHQGLGGYDVFFAEWDNDAWSKPNNLGVPVNSAANDFYWILNKDDSTGFFASNRSGSMTITEESCCNDIYKFAYLRKISPPDTAILAVLPPDTLELAVNKKDTVSTIAVVEVPVVENKIPTLEEINKDLPIRLYFHNDEPDSNVTVSYTKKPYELPYYYYLSLQPTYEKEYSGQFKAENQLIAAKKVNDFFELEVKAEFAKMNLFFDNVLELLKKGANLEIQIKGFTSPRSYSSYNIALGQRRVMSVKNQIMTHKNGALSEYYKKGNLTVKELSFGETTAPKGISDAFNDPKNSIFSVEASKERRVEIVSLQKKD